MYLNRKLLGGLAVTIISLIVFVFAFMSSMEATPLPERLAVVPEDPMPQARATASVALELARYMDSSRIAKLVCTSPLDYGQTAWSKSPAYGGGGWSSIHGDGRNSDSTPLIAPRQHELKWHIFQGQANILTGSLDASGTLYSTFAQGRGFSHLRAIDKEGAVLWESEPMEDWEGLDWAVGGNAPLIDPSGNLYVADYTQLWSFKTDGTVNWAVPLVAQKIGHASLFFSKQGWIGRIAFNGLVEFYRPTDGSLAIPPFQIPKGDTPKAEDTPIPPGLWEGMVDPGMIKVGWLSFVGGSDFQLTNTPGVDPLSGLKRAPSQLGEGVLAVVK